MSEQESPYSADDRARWKKTILAKGGDVSARLEAVLAKKEVDLSDVELTQTDDEKEPPEKRLRRYLDLLMARLRVVDDPRFGYDPERGRFLTVPELDEMPWIECDP